MESFINPATLNEFKLTFSKFTPVWNGPEPAHDLYVAWKKAKDFVLLSKKTDCVLPISRVDETPKALTVQKTPDKVSRINADEMSYLQHNGPCSSDR